MLTFLTVSQDSRRDTREQHSQYVRRYPEAHDEADRHEGCTTRDIDHVVNARTHSRPVHEHAEYHKDQGESKIEYEHGRDDGGSQ